MLHSAPVQHPVACLLPAPAALQSLATVMQTSSQAASMQLGFGQHATEQGRGTLCAAGGAGSARQRASVQRLQAAGAPPAASPAYTSVPAPQAGPRPGRGQGAGRQAIVKGASRRQACPKPNAATTATRPGGPTSAAKGLTKSIEYKKGDITKGIRQNPAAARCAAQAEVSTPFPPALQRQLLLADQHAVQVSIHPVARPDLDAADHNPHLWGRVACQGGAAEMRQTGEHCYAKGALQAHD